MTIDKLYICRQPILRYILFHSEFGIKRNNSFYYSITFPKIIVHTKNKHSILKHGREFIIFSFIRKY